ncbi:uncharacterized protein MONOS_7115 [Monocercomonoides exilis]|uniref:uncharacterized protein n=1 Tax=Monocercomonoides exilis TaxID=2049356 RepID=UPI0035594898|nr:hypothetical protein MONOS_7115 [Monocercomonoides exilis]|eukprot:MONOS_7115.1-p1 / transcript=MONOS_7115.1 / gene=MONOS_7115 / organism=Monocercomonoides_exilis_PA203 / gene_product=unspecified product / transcript_product=unspecified product / location=Mono_scaffold00236:67041-69928(+) / protein_length=551 / sequence_SO=supercontig / SO=protein_coding / is_pseudo=false
MNEEYLVESQKIYTTVFKEICRQVSLQHPERGRLMITHWNKYMQLTKKIFEVSVRTSQENAQKYKEEVEAYIRKLQDDHASHLKSIHVQYTKELKDQLKTITDLNTSLIAEQTQLISCRKEVDSRQREIQTMEQQLDALNALLVVTETKCSRLEKSVEEYKKKEDAMKETTKSEEKPEADCNYDWLGVDEDADGSILNSTKPLSAEEKTQLVQTIKDLHLLVRTLLPYLSPEQKKTAFESIQAETEMLNEADFGDIIPFEQAANDATSALNMQNTQNTQNSQNVHVFATTSHSILSSTLSSSLSSSISSSRSNQLPNTSESLSQSTNSSSSASHTKPSPSPLTSPLLSADRRQVFSPSGLISSNKGLTSLRLLPLSTQPRTQLSSSFSSSSSLPSSLSSSLTSSLSTSQTASPAATPISTKTLLQINKPANQPPLVPLPPSASLSASVPSSGTTTPEQSMLHTEATTPRLIHSEVSSPRANEFLTITSDDVQGLVDALPESHSGIWKGRKIVSFSDLDALLNDMANEIITLRREKDILMELSTREKKKES